MDVRGWLRTVAALAVTGATLLAGWRRPVPDAAVGPSAPPWRRDSVGVVLRNLTVPAVGAIAVILAGLVLQRWRPRAGYVVGLAGMVGYGVLGGNTFALVVPGIFAAAGLVRRIGIQEGWPWLFGLPVALWSSVWDQPALGLTDQRLLWSLGTATTWTVLPAVFVALAAGRRQAAAAARADELRRVAYEERLRVLRDIHDVVGHSLSLISLQSGVALRVLDADPPQARASLEAIRSSSKQALAELRETLGVFREQGPESAPLSPTPGLAAIPRLADDLRTGGVQIALDPLPDAAGVGEAVGSVAYRVVQEALTNAVRHAPGEAVRVSVARRPGWLDVRVANAGAPGGPVVEGGGLHGMRQRVESLGGTLAAGPESGEFVVAASLPLAREEAA